MATNKKMIEAYSKLLVTEKEKVLLEVNSFGPNAIMDQREVIEDIEAANMGVLNSITVRLNDRKYNYLKKVEQAIDKLRRGTYGDCEECGCEIGIKRLRARPTAELCMECKIDREQEEKNQMLSFNSGKISSWEKEREGDDE